MADWIRNTVMLTGAVVWTVFIIVNLARGDDVDPIVWGFPAALYFALNPTWKKAGKDGPS